MVQVAALIKDKERKILCFPGKNETNFDHRLGIELEQTENLELGKASVALMMKHETLK